MADNLADGQSVSLTLPIGPPRDIVSVHKDAITRGVDGAAVFVVNGDAAERRLVSHRLLNTRFPHHWQQ